MIAAGPRRRLTLPRLAGLPIAAGLAFLALSTMDGLHQAAGAALVVVLVWSAYGIVVRLFPGLDPVPSLLLASMLAVSVVALLVVAVVAASVRIAPRPMVVTAAAAAGGLILVGETLGRAPAPYRWWASRRTMTFAALTAAACGLLVTDAGAVTARLAPRAAPAPYSSFSFAGPAARWSQELSVSPGAVVTVPLQIVNRTGRRATFVVDSDVGGSRHTLATVALNQSASWSAAFPITVPSSGCPSRLAFDSTSGATTETLDIWLHWSDPSCA